MRKVEKWSHLRLTFPPFYPSELGLTRVKYGGVKGEESFSTHKFERLAHLDLRLTF